MILVENINCHYTKLPSVPSLFRSTANYCYLTNWKVFVSLNRTLLKNHSKYSNKMSLNYMRDSFRLAMILTQIAVI